MAKGPEKKFEDKLRKALTERGAVVRKLHGSQFQRDLPDLLVGFEGRIFMIEVKAGKPHGNAQATQNLLMRMSVGQKFEASYWTRAKCEYWVVLGDGPTDRAFAARLKSGTVSVPERTIDAAAEYVLRWKQMEA
jgi:hypothetical protein